ncbi:MAG: Fe-S cluster assembly ATPase SufC [Clostridia bacterium]|nr:Fe-S cluster assembly ATPase SufC [Clostridia bacterium]
MADALLQIRGLTVRVGEKEILHGLDLDVGAGETHVLMGPNGAGKSTLGNAIMGNPTYEVTAGEIWFDGKNILEEGTDARAKDGLFMSFQNPLEVPGITLSNFIRSALEQRTGERVRLWDFRKSIKKEMQLLNMDESYADRDLTVGFSGGEKKKSEILQLLMLTPKLAILDETDSGLDVDAVRTVSKGVEEFQKTRDGALLIITHSTRILEALDVDYTHVLVDGNIVETGDGSLVDELNETGFEKYLGANE